MKHPALCKSGQPTKGGLTAESVGLNTYRKKIIFLQNIAKGLRSGRSICQISFSLLIIVLKRFQV
jgi:hypothetical protein